MKVLKENYLEHLKERMSKLEQLLASCEKNALSAEDRAELTSQAHQLTGTGTTYGFPDITACGRKLEDDLISHPDAAAQFFVPQTRDLLAACNAALNEKPKPTGTFGRRAAPAAAPKKADLPLLLVVDDDKLTRSIMLTLFKDDARIITGVNTNEAVELMMKHKPDLVLLDDMMPGGVSGLRMLEDRQSMPEIRDIPVIMITASNKPEEIMRGLMAGALDYITKPFDPKNLAAKVRGRLKRERGTT